MDLKEFTTEATRTEATIENVKLNFVLFEELKEITVRVADCLDLIKKNVFYGKEINMERTVGNLEVAARRATILAGQIHANPNFLKRKDVAAIDPREFHGMLGIITEASEMLELVNLRDDKADTIKVVDELGDLFWYVAILADEKQVDIQEQVLEAVIAKLRKRFPDKFEQALAVTRDKEAEMAETVKVANKSKPAAKKKAATKKKPAGKKKTTSKRKKKIDD